MAGKNFYCLTEALLPDWPALSQLQQKQIAFDCAYSVKQHMAIAPHLVRIGLKVFYCMLIFCFYLSSPIKGLNMPLPRRKKLLNKILKFFPPLNLFIKAMQSLILLRYMEHPIVKSFSERG